MTQDEIRRQAMLALQEFRLVEDLLARESPEAFDTIEAMRKLRVAFVQELGLEDAAPVPGEN